MPTDFQALTALVNGKHVAVVGNSAELPSQGHGDSIDSADVVVRMNNGVPHGARVDIWATARFDSPVVLAQSCPKLVVWFKHTRFGQLQLAQLREYLAKMHLRIPLIVYPMELEDILRTRLGDCDAHPSTGLRVMHLLANFTAPRSIQVYGVPFWTAGGSTDQHWYAADPRAEAHHPLKERAVALTLGYADLGEGRWQWPKRL